MTSESKQLTGLELRKACLIAAGWSVQNKCDKPDETPCYVPFSPDGKAYYFGEYYLTENDAWQIAPAVESSVDAAREHLKLDDYVYWEIGGFDRPDYSSWDVYLISNGVHVSNTISDNPAEAMCQAWLEWANPIK